MLRRPGIITGLFLFLISFAQAQLPSRKITKEEYIGMYKDIAIEEMNMYHIPASITLAQGILESAYGNSTLAKKANNHFGIKCHKGWNGKTYHMDDDARDECFRRYNHPHESFKDHSIFLTTRDRYAFLFDLAINDYKGWAKGLKQAGYATNPKYPQLLIGIIEEYKLYEYDRYYQEPFLAENKKTSRTTASYAGSSRKEDFQPVTIGASNRQVYENNGVKFIYARRGDNFYKIARDFNIYTWQVYRYNDLKKKDPIDEGQILYLERKNRQAEQEVHVVNPGEDLYSISQQYAIKLKKLCRYNTLDKDAELFPGQRIKLKK
ncbi:MAG: glucosaminidase domain-containing protein [Bacteroidetes bacterium]|nr:glucosaminidase domain-containing protein [Bacteroidota bacterium]